MARQTTPDFIAATGRRKNAIASVRLKTGEGKILVNGRPFNEYFPTESLRNVVLAPLETAQSVKKFDLAANVKGGGPMGQAGAMRHAVARALIKFDPQLRAALKPEGFLMRDPRMKERKKPGQPGARRRFQYSKR
jgi:small subunit ribosomal protein S9